ncbi:MAG: aldo/keto reductase [Clostridiales bacterium]|nr:aldo/keto reductase [Clostridiales bacterium]
MNYRRLGKTGLMVSEIGLGGEWLERHTPEECKEIIAHCEAQGINILDCWMSEPNVRSNIGAAIQGRREKWYIQGHIGSTWQNSQYVRSRNLEAAKTAFQDMLDRFQTNYIDLGMIHYVDDPDDWNTIINGEFLSYVQDLKAQGRIRHIGMSTHNPSIAKAAVESGIIEMILFSINPAFDMLPVNGNPEVYFSNDFSTAVDGVSPERVELYQLCEQHDVGITVMKGYAGGRLFDAQRSPFGVALTPVQCLHYCLTRPAVCSVMVGFDNTAQIDEAVSYETASPQQRDYASILAGAPRHAYSGQCTYCGHCKPCPMDIDIAMVNKLYDLALMQPAPPASLRDHYHQLKTTGADCIGCKQCETRCPFGVKITERMRAAAALFSANTKE